MAEYHRAVRRLREVSDRPGGEEAIRAGVEEIAALRRKYSRLETTLRNESPYCRSLWGDPAASPDWTQVTAKLLSPDVSLLYYHFGGAKSYLFLVSPNDSGGERAPRVDAIELRAPERLARRAGGEPGPVSRRLAKGIFEIAWRELALPPAAESRAASSSAAGADSNLRGFDRDEQQALAEMLLPSAVRAAMKRSKAGYAYVSLDPVVRQPPLEGLLLDAAADKYVAELLPPLSYAPSAILLLGRTRIRATREQKPVSLLAVGVGRPSTARDPASADSPGASLASTSAVVSVDTESTAKPTFDAATTGLATVGAHYLAIGGSLAPLWVAEQECARIESRFAKAAPRPDSPPLDILRLEGNAATKSRVREALAGRAFVHLAARGATDDRRGELFGTAALASDPAAPPDERFLALSQLPALPLGACQLVALGHWAPRASSQRGGDPNDWLALGFMAAGAEDVLMSQWSGDDDAAALLVESFWSHVAGDLERKTPPRFAAALAAARADVRRDSRFHAPRYWASWMLVGPTH